MRMKRKVLPIALTIAAAAGLAIAQERIERRHAASPDGVVTIENIAGSVTVKGWSRDEVEVTGTLGRGVRELVFEASGDRTTIRVELEEGERRVEGSDLVVQVPGETRLEVETVSANVQIADLSGQVEISTVSGEVESAGRIRSADISTVSGQIRFATDDVLEEGEFHSVSGRIDVDADLRSTGRLELETVSGPIELTVPRGISARFEVSTFSGDITNDFGEEPRKKDKYLPSKELVFALGGGGPRISVQTLSGTIDLKGK